MADPTSDRECMLRAMTEAINCVSEAGKNSPKVGAVVVKAGVFLGASYRGEKVEGFLNGAGDHAEFVLLQKKLSEKDLTGATVYTTLEPCTSRNQPKQPCAKWLADRKVGEVVIGLLDPDPRIYGNGLKALKDSGITVRFFPEEFHDRLKQIDARFRAKFTANADSKGKATFNYMRNNGIFTIDHGDNIFETRWEKNSADTINLRNDTASIDSVAVAIHATTFEEVTEPGVYDMSTWNIPVQEGEIAVLRNRQQQYALVKVVDVKHKGFEDRDEMTIEFVILSNPPAEPIVESTLASPGKADLISTEVAKSETPATTAAPSDYLYKSFLTHVGVPIEEEPIRQSVASVEQLERSLAKLPEEARMVLVEVIERSTEKRHSRYPMAAICREIELALHVSVRELKEYVAMLKRHKIAVIDEDDEDGLWKICLRWWPTDWNIWEDLRRYCEEKSLLLREIVAKLRFDLLN